MAELTASLARAGVPEAQLAWEETQSAASDPARSRGERRMPDELASAMTAMGDIAGAMDLAERAGPLVAPASPQAAYIAALMSMADTPGFENRQPDPAELAVRAAEAARHMPRTIVGSKANILSAIAVEAALDGRIDVALRAETGLETEPRDVLAPARDRALAAIAEAMMKQDDPEGSLAISARITEARTRLIRLIGLAALPIQTGNSR